MSQDPSGFLIPVSHDNDVTLAQALANLRTPYFVRTSNTGDLLVISLKGFNVRISGVHSPDDLIEWFRNKGAFVTPLEEWSHPPKQQDLLEDPRNSSAEPPLRGAAGASSTIPWEEVLGRS
jgi:hypothetical protein